jgi:hypothetical protein
MVGSGPLLRRTAIAFSCAALWSAARETVHVSGMIILIVAGAKLFGHVSTTMQIPQGFAQWLTAAGIGPVTFIAVTMLVLILLGDFLDPISIILIVVPVLLPAMAALHIDPLWFGVLLVINMELANITPPVGLNLFVIQGIQSDLSYQQVLRGTAPFMFGPTAATDVFIEASGADAVLGDVLRHGRVGGRMVVVALHYRPVPTSFVELLMKEFTIRGSMEYPARFEDAVDLLARRDLSELITHTLPLDEFGVALEVLEGEKDCGKVMITMEGAR